jgi:protocatechuate 3,4-dioxygenase beta subunit
MPADSSRVPIDRRAALRWLGVIGLGTVAVACSDGGGSGGNASSGTGADADTAPRPSGGTATNASCVLTPEMTEGPYFVDGDAMRSDITEGRPGAPLTLRLSVVDATGCQPVEGAAVDIWHADASGDYSAFGRSGPGTTFLRGIQETDADGVATFRTIYPGWYQGRAVHVHVKVSVGGSRVHTGQLFFADDVSGTVFAAKPYAARGDGWVRNADDSIFADGGDRSIVGLEQADGAYSGSLTMGIDRAS